MAPTWPRHTDRVYFLGWTEIVCALPLAKVSAYSSSFLLECTEIPEETSYVFMTSLLPTVIVKNKEKLLPQAFFILFYQSAVNTQWLTIC